jgi:hypothetical protein
VEGSIIYILLRKVYHCYQYSFLRKTVVRIVEAYRNSLPGRAIKAVVERESSLEHSIFVRMVKTLFYGIDKWVRRFSKSICGWSEASVIVRLVIGIIKISGHKSAILAIPVFGTGYLAGRIIQNRLMIRDILFLGLTFIVAAIFMLGLKNIKNVWKNSLAYKLYVLVME